MEGITPPSRGKKERKVILFCILMKLANPYAIIKSDGWVSGCKSCFMDCFGVIKISRLLSVIVL